MYSLGSAIGMHESMKTDHNQVPNSIQGTSTAVHGRHATAWGLLVSRATAPSTQLLETMSNVEKGMLKSGADEEVLHAGVLQWLGTLGTYAATTLMWLWEHAPQAHVAQRVCVQWAGASVGEMESIPLLEAILLHSLPECKVQSSLVSLVCFVLQ